MEVKIQLESDAQRLELFGPSDAHLRQLRDALDVKVSARNGTVLVSGEPTAVRIAADLIDLGADFRECLDGIVVEFQSGIDG